MSAKIFILLLLSSLFVWVLAIGFQQGSFFEEGAKIYSLPWGKVTLFDLYLGLGLFSTFIAYTESSKLKALVWIMGVMIFGNIVSLIYLLVYGGRLQKLFERSER